MILMPMASIRLNMSPCKAILTHSTQNSMISLVMVLDLVLALKPISVRPENQRRVNLRVGGTTSNALSNMPHHAVNCK